MTNTRRLQSRALSPRHSRRLTLGAAVLTSVLVAASAASASAANAEDSFDPFQIVQSQGLLHDGSSLPGLDASRGSTYDLVGSAGLGTIAPVTITPVTDAPAVVVSDTLVSTGENHGFVTGASSSATNASFAVLKDESAPDAYQFEIGDESTVLTLNADGTVSVSDTEGNPVNYFSAPWARDAEGRYLPTNYTVNGNVITQHIDTSGATYPVVADPTSGCGLGWCSVYFNRAETNGVAAGGPYAATAISAACALANPIAGGACAIATGAIVAFAAGANANGDCFGLLFTPLGWNPFIEPRGTSHCP